MVVEKQVTIVITAKDNATAILKKASAAQKKAFGGVGGAAKKAGGLVNENMGKAMVNLNEKTERARQVLGVFGGTLGGVAGDVVFFGGTFASILGGFKLWQLALVGATAAIVIMGKALSDLAFNQINAANKRLEEAKEQTKKVRDEMKALGEEIELSQLKAKGMSGYAAKLFLVNRRSKGLRDHLIESKRQFKDLAIEIVNVSNELGSRDALTSFQMTERLAKLSLRFEGLKVAIDGTKEKLRAAKIEAKGLSAAIEGIDKPAAAKVDVEEKKKAAAEKKNRAKRWRELQRKKKAEQLAATKARAQDILADAAHNQKKLDLLNARLQKAHDAEVKWKEKNDRLRDQANDSVLGKLQAQSDDELALEEKKFEAKEAMNQAIIDQTEAMLTALVDDGLKGVLLYVSNQLKGLAIEAAARALFMSGMALWHFAMGNPLLAKAALGAAAEMAAFAVLFGAGAAAASSLASSAGGSGSDEGGTGAIGGFGNEVSREPTTRTVTVIIQAGVLTGRRAGKEIQQVLEENDNFNHPNRLKTKLSG